MNTGRLHALLDLIQRDYETNEIPQRLQAAADTLSASISAPTEEHAATFREALEALYLALDNSPFNTAPPSQIEMLMEIGAADKVGSELRQEIQSTLDSNTVTPAAGLAELQRINQVVSKFFQVVEQLRSGFTELGISGEVLKPGETEFGATIPWPTLDGNLEGLQKTLHQYDRALKAFGELADDNPQSPVIRSVGSSALQVFMQSSPAIALCIATAIERLCALYKQLLEIKLLRKEVRKKSLPEEVASSIEAHEKRLVEDGIHKIVEDLLKEFGKKKERERLNELRKALQAALTFLAEQIDSGADLEVTAEPPRLKDVAESEGEPAKSDKAKRALEAARKNTARIQKAGNAMRTLPRAGEPILALDTGDKRKKT
jgi:hypothetical protein